MTETTSLPSPTMAAASKDQQQQQQQHNESEVYDRQIRLWGAESQAKISRAKVLYVHLTGVSSEVLKNLVLAGVRPVLCDNRPHDSDVIGDMPSFFFPDNDDDDDEKSDRSPTKKRLKFASVAHAMQEAVEELNPLLGTCEILDMSVEDIDEDVLKQFTMVICSRVGKAEATRLAKATTTLGGTFYLVDCFGWDGAAVVDLGPTHTYREDIKKTLSDLRTVDTYVTIEDIWTVPVGDVTRKRIDKTPPTVWISYRAILEYQSRTDSWPSADKADDFVRIVQEWIAQEAPHLKELDLLQVDSLKTLASVATAEVSPVCAALGGSVGNEVIKAISGRGEPANNVLLFYGREGKCRTVLIKPKPQS